MSDGIAIDGGIVEDRQIDWSGNGSYENASVGVGKEYAFRIGDRRYASRHQGKRFLDPHQFSAKGKCVRTQLRHRFPAIRICSSPDR